MEQYHILGRIGEGAHGIVFKAKHIEVGLLKLNAKSVPKLAVVIAVQYSSPSNYCIQNLRLQKLLLLLQCANSCSYPSTLGSWLL